MLWPKFRMGEGTANVANNRATRQNFEIKNFFFKRL